MPRGPSSTDSRSRAAQSPVCDTWWSMNSLSMASCMSPPESESVGHSRRASGPSPTLDDLFGGDGGDDGDSGGGGGDTRFERQRQQRRECGKKKEHRHRPRREDYDGLSDSVVNELLKERGVDFEARRAFLVSRAVPRTARLSKTSPMGGDRVSLAAKIPLLNVGHAIFFCHVPTVGQIKDTMNMMALVSVGAYLGAYEAPEPRFEPRDDL